MSIDKKLSSLSLILLIIISLCFLLPLNFARGIAAILIAAFAAIIAYYYRKRKLLSINKNIVTILITTIVILYVLLLYLAGLKFGFFKSTFPISLSTIFLMIIPSLIVIFSSEFLRYVLISQESKTNSVFAFLICVISEILITTNIRSINSFNSFMDLFGKVLLPILVSNYIFMKLSKWYGFWPSTIYKTVIILYPYIIPIVPNIHDAIMVLSLLILPLIIYVFINSLFEKKVKLSERKNNIIDYISFGIVCLFGVVMVCVISCKFRFCALVIATDSMQKEINQGDMVIYEKLDNDDVIFKDQIIVFEKNGSLIVHRVFDIENIDGQIRYYTKGDNNEDVDDGFITRSNIIGYVHFKISYFGYPSILLRDMFETE